MHIVSSTVEWTLEQVLTTIEAIATQIHQSTDLNTIFNCVVGETRELFQCDRVLIYQISADSTGVVVAESLATGSAPAIGQKIDDCLPNQWQDFYRSQQTSHIHNVDIDNLPPAQVEWLQRLQVKAKLVVPILIQSTTTAIAESSLWGVLTVHQCHAPRIWQSIEVATLQHIATQLSIALQRHNLLCPQHESVTTVEPRFDTAPHQPDQQTTCIQVVLEIASRRLEGGNQVAYHHHEMLHKLAVQVPGVIYQYHLYPDGYSYFPYASEAIRQIYEVTPEQAQRSADIVLQRLHPDDEAGVIGSIQTSFQTLQLWHQEYRVILPEKGLRWLEGHATPEPMSDGSVLWHGYIWDITDRKLNEKALQQRTEQERLITSITQNIRQSLNLHQILSTTVTEVRQFLHTDRVIVYRLNSNWSGVVMTESVAPEWKATLNMEITDSCIVETQGSHYHDNYIYAIDDIYTHNFSQCYSELLAQLQVRAKLVVPILQGEKLWGLLIAHHCCTPRQWQPFEGELLLQLANQLAIAIHQSELHQQVQQLNSHLESQVVQRTAQLQQSLEFDALLKRITDKVRDSLDEQQILQTVVEELAHGLGIEACDTGIYNPEQTTSTIAYEYTKTLSPAQGCTFTIADAPHAEVYPYLLQGQTCHFSNVTPNPLRSPERKLTVLACPIVDEQTVLGDLWLFKPPSLTFSDLEVRLVQQVANHCAIALRQSRLYHAAQAQVEELARLNQLKDDFLNTVSHELRTPIASIQMATRMLAICLQTTGAFTNGDARINRYFQILQTECQRETNLINDLLDLARIDSGTEPLRLTTVDLPLWLPHLIEPFVERAQSHNRTLTLRLATPLPAITTDLPYLERVLTELLHNACKYTPAGEHITLMAEPLRHDDRNHEHPFVLIAISNSGVEIAETERDRIFDKFYRIPNSDPWKHGGTGLGLALVRKLVERIGGTINVSSEPSCVTFTLTLPGYPACLNTDRKSHTP